MDRRQQQLTHVGGYLQFNSILYYDRHPKTPMLGVAADGVI